MQQAMHTMNKRVNIEWNRVFHSEDSMIMYGIYNVDMLEKLIQMVHKMNTKSLIRLLSLSVYMLNNISKAPTHSGQH